MAPRAKRSGPQCDTTSAARRPIARRDSSGRAAIQASLIVIASRSSGSNRLPVVPSGSGTSVGAQPACVETRSGKPLAAASLTTSPHGSERLGSTNAAAWAYHRGSESACRKPGRWIACAQPLSAIASVDFARARAVTTEDEVPGRACGTLPPVTRESPDQPDQVFLGHEPADRQEIGSAGQARAAFRTVTPGMRLVREKVVVDRVVSQGDAVRGHAEIRQVITVWRPADQGRVEPAQPPPLDQLFPPDARPIDRLALGHQDRRPAMAVGPPRRGHRFRAHIADDAQGIGTIPIERQGDRPAAVGRLDRFEDPVGKQRDPRERLVVLATTPWVPSLTARDFIGDQPVPCFAQPGCEQRAAGLDGTGRNS